ncbi:MAG: 4-(cytidine 5'-diphospho)-2-C-methyl-D-erythritol kinase [Thermodesulfobacteriota bacterium]
MSPKKVRVGCKVNLFLEITGVREDGYHELKTLFYPVPEPHDILGFAPGVAAKAGPDGRPASRVGDGLALWCSEAALETPSNIVAKAYEAFAARTGFRPELTALLSKGIPHGAGLGGGSADAAAMLSWLNAESGEKALAQEDLAALAAKLGADVPFFLMNRPAWATGIGERLAPAEVDFSGMTMLVAVPPERVNTAWAYKAWDAAARTVAHEGAKGFLTRDRPASMRPFCVYGAFIANGFETVVFKEFPAIRLLKERLYGLGAAAACMSGSGSAVFALFRDPAKADAAASVLGPTAAVFSAAL